MPRDPLEPPPVDLDHNATTPIDPEVADVVRRVMLDTPGNPASAHSAGRKARKVLETARERIGELLGCAQSDIRADRVIFTSGGTEANNLAIFGLGRAPHDSSPAEDRIIVSAIEHPSVMAAAERLRELGATVDPLHVDRAGVARIEHLRELLAASPRPRLVSLMAANNETGVVQPIDAAAELCRTSGVLFHTDAVQIAGKLPIAFHAWGVDAQPIDALTIAAHKFHGPRGIGALIVRHGVPLRPQLFGGFQQAAARPGTESPALAAGLARALELYLEDVADRVRHMTLLRERFEAGLRARCAPVEIHGAHVPRLPHTTNVAFPGVDRQALVLALDFAGVLCSSGSACASGSSEPSPVLQAMDCTPEQVSSSVRFSLGHETTTEQMIVALARIEDVVQRLRRSSSAEFGMRSAE